MYAQSLSLRSEELDADTVYSFVPNIGDSNPSSRCTYSKITNGADVDLNHTFEKRVLRTQLCVHHDAEVIVIWVIWSKCASKRTKMRVMENPAFPSHLGKYIVKIGKISTKIHEIGKLKAIFGLGMTLI